MISVEEALARVLALSPEPAQEVVPLRRAAGRVMLGEAVAALDQPPFPASAMDGYAIRDSDHHAGCVLAVVGVSAAGRGYSGAVNPGEAVRIFTGAPVPNGADRVILQEDVDAEGSHITLGSRLEGATHIRPMGQDFRKGQPLAGPRMLRAADVALLAAMNVAEVGVARRPVVALLATGDELVVPGEVPTQDQIIASNSFALAAMAEAAGAEVRLLPIARDTEASLRFSFGLAEDADLVVTIGGASVGDHDLVGKVASDLGMERAFWKIAMRPGKPLMAGRMGASAMLGLPGNPVSAIVCGHLFMLPLIRRMQGHPQPAPHFLRAELARDVPANGPRAHYMRACLADGEGLPRITPFDSQDSALLTILSEANALLVRPVSDIARHAGETVDYLPI